MCICIDAKYFCICLSLLINNLHLTYHILGTLPVYVSCGFLSSEFWVQTSKVLTMAGPWIYCRVLLSWSLLTPWQSIGSLLTGGWVHRASAFHWPWISGNSEPNYKLTWRLKANVQHTIAWLLPDLATEGTCKLGAIKERFEVPWCNDSSMEGIGWHLARPGLTIWIHTERRANGSVAHPDQS